MFIDRNEENPGMYGGSSAHMKIKKKERKISGAIVRSILHLDHVLGGKGVFFFYWY